MVNIWFTHIITRLTKFTVFISRLAEKIQSISNIYEGFGILLPPIRKKLFEQKYILLWLSAWVLLKVYEEIIIKDFASLYIFTYFL